MTQCIAISLVALAMLAALGCTAAPPKFSDDVALLQKHTDLIVLKDSTGDAQIAVVPDYQGRVMTSTAAGADGMSFGWINHDLIRSGETVPHINPWGGEDRFWMGPEGGQFAIFFKKGDPFDLEHWQTPAVIDTEIYDLVSKDDRSAVFTKRTKITNASGTTFDVKIDRTIRLLERPDAARQLGMNLPDSVKAVAFESDNSITNAGSSAWTKDGGLLSIWILGMFVPSDETTIVIPFHPGPKDRLGRKVNDEYFGKVPPERLVVKEDVLYFSGDGQYRSKIGLSPQRSKPVLGSYDAVNGVLTVVQYTKPADATEYVNSMWAMQEKPYAGDVVNSYNDGPPEPGKEPLGPFYELETSSPAADLKPGQKLSHVHRTFHFQGPEDELNRIARHAFGVGLDEIKTALP